MIEVIGQDSLNGNQIAIVNKDFLFYMAKVNRKLHGEKELDKLVDAEFWPPLYNLFQALSHLSVLELATVLTYVDATLSFLPESNRFSAVSYLQSIPLYKSAEKPDD